MFEIFAHLLVIDNKTCIGYPFPGTCLRLLTSNTKILKDNTLK